MLKKFCDICGVEIYDQNKFYPNKHITSELRLPNGKSKQVSVNISEVLPLDYDICKYCVFDAIKKADDRPKEESIL